MNKPLAGHFAKAGVTPRRHLVEIRTADAAEYTLGQELTAELFEAGEEVDVTGTSKGKGFAGVMKRHGFHGVGASHGAHRNHRKPGSIGACATPGRVFKGMRMAGRMGGDRQTTQNLTVHAVDAEQGPDPASRAPFPAPSGGRRPRPHRREGSLTPWPPTIDVLDADGRDRPARSTCPPRSSTSRSTSR